MGQRNVLIEGVSGTGKTTICDGLLRRGYHAIHGDRDLRPNRARESDRVLQSDADRAAFVHAQGRWDVPKVRDHWENGHPEISFFCGGFRNHADFVGLFDAVFVLEVDLDTLMRRLEDRPEEEVGGNPVERALIKRLRATGEDMPKGAIPIDARKPIDQVADDIVKTCRKLGLVR